MRIPWRKMLDALCRTGRRDWDRGWGHRYLGHVTAPEYRWEFTWDAWTYRTPRSRESVVILARYTKRHTLRVVTCGGVPAARMVAAKGG